MFMISQILKFEHSKKTPKIQMFWEENIIFPSNKKLITHRLSDIVFTLNISICI